MTDEDRPVPAGDDERRGRKFAVSANRNRGRHRVRYVETGGAAVDPEDCVFCEVRPSPGDAASPEPDDPDQPDCTTH